MWNDLSLNWFGKPGESRAFLLPAAPVANCGAFANRAESAQHQAAPKTVIAKALKMLYNLPSGDDFAQRVRRMIVYPQSIGGTRQ